MAKKEPTSGKTSRTKSRKNVTKNGKKAKHSYSRAIYDLMKSISPDCQISIKAMQVMNSFIEDLLSRISSEACNLIQIAGKSRMSEHDIKAATKLIIQNPELLKFALQMANRTIKQAAEKNKAKKHK